jgi:probable F420-dependent oxidoreductase
VTDSQRPSIAFPARIGVWWVSETWAMPAAQEVAQEIESLGYGSLFIPEVVGKECLTQSMAFLAATERLVLGTGIANIHARIPSAAETGARTISALYPERFVLGLGVSHAPLVERAMGGTYAKPLATMRDYLDKMAAVSEAIEPGAGRPVRLLAALGPKMIELSGSHADGAHPYLVLPEHTAVTRSILGPDKWIVSEQAVTIGGSRDEQMQWAHGHLMTYSGLPNYRNSWLRQGFDESDLVKGGSTQAPTTSSYRSSATTRRSILGRRYANSPRPSTSADSLRRAHAC